MAETLLSFGVQKLWDLLARESDRFKEVDEQLTELKSDLSLLRSFLKDAEAKKHASALVRNCVEEIKEIVFDTEDIIETFLLKEELRKTSGIKKRMRRLSCIIADRMEIASDMGGISKRISKVIRDMQSFGVQQLIVNGGEYSHPLQERQREMRHTFPSDNESDLVGLEKNVKKLVGYLVEEDNIQVVSITGMGGIGKTTLARQVFNHEMVKNHFDGVAWVCVSQQFTRKYVWGMILQKLSPKHDEHKELEMSEDQLQQKLFQLLETSNSLIVLDDMWKEEDWDRIQPVFPPTKGWKVILTSRNQGVALHADPTCVTFKPECLTFEQSWTLFQRTAFPRKDRSKFMIDVEMEEMGKKMIKHCGGLPLAVKVLGGLLASQQTLSEWKRVYDNIASHIVGGGTTFNEGDCKSVQHVLSLSFEELPISLKHCFLYLAHYPENYPIYMETLSYYWAAERIPKPKYYEQASIEEVADIYIEELVKRNMVISERDGRTSRFDTCHLHDMMREICLLKAKEENFLQIVHGTSPAYSKSPCKSRRLAVHRLDETYHQEREMKSPKLRSLLCIFEDGRTDWMAPSLFLSKLQLMRVLNLSEIKFEGGKLPSNIGKLIHLRYLSLFMTRVSHLPSSMGNLKQLIYLNLHVAARSLYVPNIFNKMVQLRFLSFPREIHDKTKLELGHLINLETLENFSTEHASVRDLQGMTRLRTLSILFNSKGCNVETLSSSLSGMSHLENLTIEYSKVYYAEECFFSWGRLRQVYSPMNDEEGFVLKCVHLKQLNLSIYMPRLPDEQHFPSQLTTITLTWCYLEEDPMPVLEKLLHLKEIFLYARAFSGKRMVCSDGGFPQLEKLVLFGLDEWEEWIVEKGSMPLLHVLRIKGCEKLKELPDGLRFTTSLKLLRIFTKEWEWKEKLEKGGEDYYKIQHIPLVQIYL